MHHIHHAIYMGDYYIKTFAKLNACIHGLLSVFAVRTLYKRTLYAWTFIVHTEQR